MIFDAPKKVYSGWGNEFVITGAHEIEVLFHTFY